MPELTDPRIYAQWWPLAERLHGAAHKEALDQVLAELEACGFLWEALRRWPGEALAADFMEIQLRRSLRRAAHKKLAG